MISTVLPLTFFSYVFLQKLIASIIVIILFSFLHATKTTTPLANESQSTAHLLKPPHSNTTTATDTNINAKTTINEPSTLPALEKKHDTNDKIKTTPSFEKEISDNSSTLKTKINDTASAKPKLNQLNSFIQPPPLDTLYEETATIDKADNNHQSMTTLLSIKCPDHYKENNKEQQGKKEQKIHSLRPSFSTPSTSLYHRRRQGSNTQLLSPLSFLSEKDSTPLLSPSLSASTTSSQESWSSSPSTISKVESLVHQFEYKSFLLPESKVTSTKVQDISSLQRRSFAFKPIVEHWEKRIPKDKPYIAPTPSLSTPVWSSRRR
ncbi:hypothetical protein BJ944DRAFT_273598 [Cunninghamella echinulata]|nr:hypothetical protein BJ944DRAFT_273598 [Cunninghamella echinulata]